MVYLDYLATTPCDARVVEAMLPYFTHVFANPHSDHQMGQEAAEAVEQARAQIAALIGVSAQEIIFTSGATESNNLAIKGIVRHLLSQGASARRVITVATEHKTMLETVLSLKELGIDPVFLPVDINGLVDPNTLQEALKVPTLLVSIMTVNNETGCVQPIAELSTIAHENGALFHSDIAQAVGKMADPFTMGGMGIDCASISAHKIYGPKGIGALYVRRKPRVRLFPLFSGGFQERGLRSGTLPVPLIVGFGKACAIIQQEGHAEVERFAQYKQYLLEGLQNKIPGIKINGSLKHLLPGAINLCFPKVRALDLLRCTPHLCLSTGSACTNSFISPSYVLLEMGIAPEEAFQSIRLSIGRMTTSAELDQVIYSLSHAWYKATAQAD